MREFLKGLDLDGETIDTIMAEYGKLVTKDKEDIQNLKGQVASLRESSGADWKTKFEELDNKIKNQEAEKKAKEDDEILVNNINQAFGNKKFVNEYTKNSIINEIKTALKDSANTGKSAKDLFEEITKDKEGIFSNPNPGVGDMPGVSDNVDTGNITKSDFDKMGYQQRLEFKQSNPELFKKYNEQ